MYYFCELFFIQFKIGNRRFISVYNYSLIINYNLIFIWSPCHGRSVRHMKLLLICQNIFKCKIKLWRNNFQQREKVFNSKSVSKFIRNSIVKKVCLHTYKDPNIAIIFNSSMRSPVHLKNIQIGWKINIYKYWSDILW